MLFSAGEEKSCENGFSRRTKAENCWNLRAVLISCGLMLANLRELVEAQRDYMVELRRRLHRILEPGFGENKTAALIAEELSKLDLEVQTGIAKTGITVDLETVRPGEYVALRADMDGLALKESSGVDYVSENDGYSHGCGHDGHTAALIGQARR